MPDDPAGFSYHPGFLSVDELADLERFVESVEWHHDEFRGNRLKRGYVQFGWSYVTQRRNVVPATPFPEILLYLGRKCEQIASRIVRFDQCIMTQYPQKVGISPHVDKPCFGDSIVAVSLGSPARLIFRAGANGSVHRDVTVESGSAYVLEDEARWRFHHEIAPVNGLRVSITFRTVVNSMGII